MSKQRTISLDLRERILAAYDEKKGTQADVARRFRVSFGMVKKLLAQRRHDSDIAPRHHRSGRKPMITNGHRQELQKLVGKKPDMTLTQLRDALGLSCTPQAIHYVLEKMGLTFKKRHSALSNKTD